MRCDLHTHTVHSDGSYSVKRLVSEAKELDLIIALTDHNTVSGLREFLAEAEAQGVTAIGGTELSTVWEGREFHLLGLFIDPEHFDRLESLFLHYHQLKEQSNIDLVEKLNKMGYKIDFAEIKRKNINGRVNRAHIADELIKCGYVSSSSEAFANLLEENCGIYIPPERLPLTDAVRLLREMRALPILAHPLKEIGIEKLEEMLPKLISCGLVGIETMHSSYSEEQIALSKALAEKYNLLESGGSDFHGNIKHGVALGVGKGNLNIPVEIYEALLKRKSEI